jgi:hypothetical protein
MRYLDDIQKISIKPAGKMFTVSFVGPIQPNGQPQKTQCKTSSLAVAWAVATHCSELSGCDIDYTAKAAQPREQKILPYPFNVLILTASLDPRYFI